VGLECPEERYEGDHCRSRRRGASRGVVAAHTTLPVLGVPMPSKHLQGLDSLLSTVQMPKGIPVATFAIGDAGAANAALFAVALLSLADEKLARKLADFRRRQTDAVLQAAPLKL